MIRVLLVGSWYAKHIVRLCGKLGASKYEDEILEAFDTHSFYERKNDIPKGLDVVYGIRPFFASNLLMKIPKARALVKEFAIILTFKRLIHKDDYTLISFQAANPVTAKLIKLAKKQGIKTHIAPLGSEVLRVSRWQEKRLFYIFTNADFVSTSRKSDFGRFLIDKYNIPQTKWVSVGYGSDIVTYLLHERIELSKKELADLLMIPRSSYYIACGYCANREQNHKEILCAIAKNKSLLPEDYLIVIQLSYGVFKKELFEELTGLAKQLELNVYFVRDFLTTEQVAYLRKLINLFIHVQKTDATNATIMEYLLCDTTIINGSWLKYSYLESKGKPYYSCDSLEELPLCINKVLRGEGGSVADANEYREVIARRKDWDLYMQRWHVFFHFNMTES